jgi:acyl-homoserine lactone acylase PvdQ
MSLAGFLMRLALGKRLPRRRGRLAAPGIHAEVEILRDGWGVPHVRLSQA